MPNVQKAASPVQTPAPATKTRTAAPAKVETTARHYDTDAILVSSAKAMLEQGGLRLGAFDVLHPAHAPEQEGNPPAGDLRLVGNGFDLHVFDHFQPGRETAAGTAGDLRVAGTIYGKQVDFSYWENNRRGPGAVSSHGQYHLSMNLDGYDKHLRDMQPIIPSALERKTALLADSATALLKQAGLSAKNLQLSVNAAPGTRGDISLLGPEASLNVFDNHLPNRDENRYGDLHITGEIDGKHIEISYWENDSRGLDAIKNNGRFHLQINVDGVETHLKNDKGFL